MIEPVLDMFVPNVVAGAVARFLAAMADIPAAVHVPRLGGRFWLTTEADR